MCRYRQLCGIVDRSWKIKQQSLYLKRCIIKFYSCLEFILQVFEPQAHTETLLLKAIVFYDIPSVLNTFVCADLKEKFEEIFNS